VPALPPRLFARGSWPEAGRLADVLRAETVGGGLLAAAAVLALAWANSPWGDTYAALGAIRIGPAALHLDLTLAQWATDGLLARFGIGEAPIGWQGTVSLWRDAADLTRFAYRQPEHRAVIARTPTDRWYAEELFARFAVRDLTGDRPVLGWLEEGQT